MTLATIALHPRTIAKRRTAARESRGRFHIDAAKAPLDVPPLVSSFSSRLDRLAFCPGIEHAAFPDAPDAESNGTHVHKSLKHSGSRTTTFTLKERAPMTKTRSLAIAAAIFAVAATAQAQAPAPTCNTGLVPAYLAHQPQ